MDEMRLRASLSVSPDASEVDRSDRGQQESPSEKVSAQTADTEGCVFPEVLGKESLLEDGC